MRYTLALLACLLLLLVPSATSTASAAPGCPPVVYAGGNALAREGGEVLALTVTLRAQADVPGGDRLTRVAITGVTNGVVEIDGAPQAVPSTVTLSPSASSWSFVLRKVSRGAPFQVTLVAADLCGDVAKFVGMGGGSTASAPSGPAPSLSPAPAPTAPGPATPAPPSLTPTVAPTAGPTAVPTVAPPRPPSATPSPVPAPSTDSAARAIELTNIERARAGLAPLRRSAELTTAAQGYAEVLAGGSCFAHTCGPVPDMVSRVERAGYTRWRALGENIAAGQQTPEHVVRMWMESPGHRENILNPAFTEVGLAVTPGAAPYGIYWAQAFGAR